MSNSQELEILDGEDLYAFPIVPTEAGGKLLTTQVKPWEPHDGVLPWRVALHPWSGGLGPNRIRPVVTFAGNLANRPSMVYAKANADATNESYLAPPPAVTEFDTPEPPTFSFYNEAAELYYGGSAYGTATYMGPLPSPINFFKALRNFAGKAYFAGGQYLYSVNQNKVFTQVKDFGTGKTVYDIEVFNNELVIAMGPAEKLWTMTQAEVFTQASDATYATALGREGDKLWRSNGNLLSNCITAPRTLTSWTPTSGNEYVAGDTSYDITDIIQALGTIAVLRPDGVYVPDHETVFHNQAPQLGTYPDIDNGKGSFVAWGYLFVPSIVGLLRLDIGESISVGPELSQRPDYRFRVRAGVEWNQDVYLLCTDEAEESLTFICKMMKGSSEVNRAVYIYHEWLRLDTVEKGYVLIVYTQPTNPIMIVGHGSHLHSITMGRGGGLDIDDPNYEFNTTWEVEPGKIIAVSDLSLEIDIEGMKIVGKQIEGATVTLAYDIDESGVYTDMLSNQDGSGKIAIADSGRFVATRYAAPNSKGHVVQTKIYGTLPAGTKSANRTEINEAWLFGSAHPEVTDIITIGLLTDRGTRVRGLTQGRSSGETVDLLKSWQASKKAVKVKLPDYSPDGYFHARIVDLEESNVQIQQQGMSEVQSSVAKIVLRRVYFGG